MVEAFVQYLLFLLAFLISYALLRKMKIFPTKINAIISLIIGFYFLSVVIFFPEDITRLLAYLVLALFVALILIAVFKAGRETYKTISEKAK